MMRGDFNRTRKLEGVVFYTFIIIIIIIITLISFYLGIYVGGTLALIIVL